MLHAARGSPSFHTCSFSMTVCGMFLYVLCGVEILVDLFLKHEATSYSLEWSYSFETPRGSEFSRHLIGLRFLGLRSGFLKYSEGLRFLGLRFKFSDTWKVREQKHPTSINGTQSKLHSLTARSLSFAWKSMGKNANQVKSRSHIQLICALPDRISS